MIPSCPERASQSDNPVPSVAAIQCGSWGRTWTKSTNAISRFDRSFWQLCWLPLRDSFATSVPAGRKMCSECRGMLDSRQSAGKLEDGLSSPSIHGVAVAERVVGSLCATRRLELQLRPRWSWQSAFSEERLRADNGLPASLRHRLVIGAGAPTYVIPADCSEHSTATTRRSDWKVRPPVHRQPAMVFQLHSRAGILLDCAYNA